MTQNAAFFQVVIGFGSSKGQTKTKLLVQSAQKINRANIKSHFGANPKVSIKPIPEVSLVPFSQMIYKKRDEDMVRQLIKGTKAVSKSIDFQQIKKHAQKQSQQLAAQLDFVKNCGQNQELDAVISKTGCTEAEANKYIKKYSNAQKAIEMIQSHNKLIDQFSTKFKCSKEQAKSFLEANNYDMSIAG